MDVLAYYKGYQSRDMPFILALFVVPVVLVFAVTVMIPIGLVKVLFRVFFPDKMSEDNVASYWVKEGVKAVVGFDSSSKYAVDFVKRFSTRDDTRFFDWNAYKGRSIKQLFIKLPDQEMLLRALWYGIDYDSVVKPPLSGKYDKNDPGEIYVVAVNKEHRNLFMLTAFPLLDDWGYPERILSRHDFEKEVDEYLGSGKLTRWRGEREAG